MFFERGNQLGHCLSSLKSIYICFLHTIVKQFFLTFTPIKLDISQLPSFAQCCVLPGMGFIKYKILCRCNLHGLYCFFKSLRACLAQKVIHVPKSILNGLGMSVKFVKFFKRCLLSNSGLVIAVRTKTIC